MHWYDEACFYHIYPLGMTGAPMQNDYSEPVKRLNTLIPFISELKNLGFNALYIGPLFESVGHGYETTDYKKLDSRLGTNEDLKNFVAECHKQGMKVIFDGVFNHTGRDFFAFKDIRENREASRYKDWYCNVNFYGNNEYNDGFSYDNWGGYNLLAKLNQHNNEVREYICDVIRFWVKEFDVDGIRLDAADVLDFGYMKMMRQVANEVKPDFWLMGEVIHGDYIRWANNETLHSVTNYHLHKALYSGHNDHNYFEIAHTVKRLYEMNKDFKLYNFVDNHDVERIHTKLNNKNHFVPTHILLYTLPGIPSVYYGSEFGIEGKKEKGSDHSLRPFISYEQYMNSKNEFTDLIGKLGEIRGKAKALSYGDYKELLLTNGQYAFSRNYEGQSVIVTVNNSDNDFSARLSAENGKYIGGIHGEELVVKDGFLSVNIKANSGEIWLPSSLSVKAEPIKEKTDAFEVKRKIPVSEEIKEVSVDKGVNKVRKSGVLMHISSLPGKYSSGSFGENAKEFIDFLSECGFSYWQVLPFCPVDEYNSPYKSYSTFAGNPYFVDLEVLYKKGLITTDELKKAEQKTPYVCEFDRLSTERYDLLLTASKRVENKEKIEKYVAERTYLNSFCEFMALKTANDFCEWQKWTTKNIDEDVLFMWKFIQFEFFNEWKEIKDYANKKGIGIIGDIPFYVSEDSADVWADTGLFELDEDFQPKKVAGVPPDYFSADGQLWGNPLYNWDKMKKDGYKWWLDRVKFMLEIFDGLRIDHFRAFESYWAVLSTEKTAKNGEWIKGPGMDLLKKIKEVAGDKLIIAEDLGLITKEVEDLVKESTFPGMRVFQFGFFGGESTHMPHNYIKNCVAYTGTHDNNTLLGYLWELDDNTRKEMLEYCGYTSADWERGLFSMIRSIWSSNADIAILTIQDMLGYGSDTRLNFPGRAEDNWRFRVTKEQLCTIDKNKFRRLNEMYYRKG